MKISVIVFALLASINAFANSCPDLSGVFSCPVWGTQPAFELTTTQSTVADVTTYHDDYGTLGDAEYTATDSWTTLASGDMTMCQNNVLYYKTPTDAGMGTASYINANGDAQADYNGTQAIICTRITK